jgi:hypothetical protein
MRRAGAQLVAVVVWALLWAMVTFVCLVWFAPPSDATRVPVDSPVLTRDYCPNVEGVQRIWEARRDYRMKLKRGHGPHAGEWRCLPRKGVGR